MKNLFKSTVLAFLTMLSFQNQIHAQLYEVPFEEKIDKSTLIIEGRVVDAHWYRGADGNIYTANEIEVTQILKGDFQDDRLTVTTWGGELDDELQTWTHMLTLSKGDYGVFCLEPTRVPTDQTESKEQIFDVYSGLQGFLKFSQNDSKAWVASEPFHRYEDIPTKIYSAIEKRTGQARTEKTGTGSSVYRGIRYHFRDFSLDGNSVRFSVYANSLVGYVNIYNAGVEFSYNPEFAGTYAVGEGYLTLDEEGLSAEPVYELALEDVNENTVKFELSTVGDPNDLQVIGPDEVLFATGWLVFTDPLADPEIEYDIEATMGMNQYLAEGGAAPFDTVIVDGKWSPESCLKINSFSPTSVAGGIGDILTINGDCFGNYVEGSSTVEFTDARKGNLNVINWMRPIPGDYTHGSGIISWTNTEIKVEVPSVHKLAYDNYTRDYYSGTGKIRVYNSEGDTATSANELLVRYSASNSFTKSGDTPPHESIERVLVDANDIGGHTITFTQRFRDSTQAFERFSEALDTWVCTTKVPFSTDSTKANQYGDKFSIDFGDLDAGTLGSTQKSTTTCTGDNGKFRARLRNVTMVFNDSISWYTGVDTLASVIGARYDFHSVALHELGHAHLLNHTNQQEDVMWYNLGAGRHRRELQADDVEGGKKIVEISKSGHPTSDFCKKGIIPATCSSSSHDIKNSENDFVTVFPNPTTSILHVRSQQIKDEKFSYRIYSTVGQEVLRGNVIQNRGLFQIDIDNLPNGLFFLFLTIDGKDIHPHKIFKQ